MSNYNSPMNLAAKARAGLARTDSAQAGYAMAALLVAMAVMAIVLSAAMPVWSHMIRREKEEELIFRGTQYARAINQYQRKFANASPREPRRADRAAHASKEIQRSAVSKQRRRVSTVVSAKSGNDGQSGAGSGSAGARAKAREAPVAGVALQSAARSGPR